MNNLDLKNKVKDDIIKNEDIETLGFKYDVDMFTILTWEKEVREEIKKINLTFIEILIDELINEKKYDEAIGICKEYIKHESIRQRLVRVYKKTKEYDKAFELNDLYNEKENPEFQRHIINILIKQNKYKEAKEICLKFQNDNFIQSLLMKIYYYHNDLDSSLQIQKKFNENIVIRSQLNKILLKNKKYNEVIENSKKTIQIKEIEILEETYQMIISQTISAYIELAKIEKKKQQTTNIYNYTSNAIKLCYKLYGNEVIMSQLISIHKILENFDEAIHVGQQDRFKNSVIIKTQVFEIKLLRANDYKKINDLEGLYYECMDLIKIYSDIKSDRNKLLIIKTYYLLAYYYKMKSDYTNAYLAYVKASELCSDENEKQISQKKIIENEMVIINLSENSIENNIINLIKDKNISLVQLKNEIKEHSEILQLIYEAAFYDFNNYDMRHIIKKIKQYKKEFLLYDYQLKIINKLLEKISSNKNNYFDTDFYLNIAKKINLKPKTRVRCEN